MLSNNVYFKFKFRKNNLHHQIARKNIQTFKWPSGFFQFLKRAF